MAVRHDDSTAPTHGEVQSKEAFAENIFGPNTLKTLGNFRGLLNCTEGPNPTLSTTALLDRLLHHAIVIQIESSSYRLRQHADLVPENVRARPSINTPQPTKRRGRPPGKKPSDLENG